MDLLIKFTTTVVIMIMPITWAFVYHDELQFFVDVFQKKLANSVPMGTEFGIYLLGPFYIKAKRQKWVLHFGVRLPQKTPHLKLWSTREKTFLLVEEKNIRLFSRTIRLTSRRLTSWDKDK
jgi:hypothetical protein